MFFKRFLAYFTATVVAVTVLCTPVFAEGTSDKPSLFDKAKEVGGNVIDTVKEKGPGWVDSAKDKIGDVYSAAKEKVPEVIDSAKDKISEAGEAFSEFREDQEDQFWDWFDGQTNGAGSGSTGVTSTSDISLAPEPDSRPTQSSTEGFFDESSVYYYDPEPESTSDLTSETEVSEAKSSSEATAGVVAPADPTNPPSGGGPDGNGVSVIALAVFTLFGAFLAFGGTMLGLHFGHRAEKLKHPKERLPDSLNKR